MNHPVGVPDKTVQKPAVLKISSSWTHFHWAEGRNWFLFSV